MQKLTRIKNLTNPSIPDNIWMDYDKLVFEARRELLESPLGADPLEAKTEIKWMLRASKKVGELPDKELSPHQLIAVLESNMNWDEEVLSIE